MARYVIQWTENVHYVATVEADSLEEARAGFLEDPSSHEGKETGSEIEVRWTFLED